MRGNGFVVAFGIASMALGCSSVQSLVDTRAFEVQPGSVIEYQHVNYAWVPTYKGYTIDANGNLFSWDRAGARWTPADEDHPTVDELNSKYLNRTAIRTIGGADVKAYFSLATEASRGSVTEPAGRCADAGEWVISAYLPSDAGHFKRVLVRQEGDLVSQNTSTAAKEVRRSRGQSGADGTVILS